METKPLLYGILGFLIGGLLVSVAAVTFNKPKDNSMEAMVASLQDKKGDAFDEAFVNEMIEHHQGAIDMARLSETRAKHQEIKDLSKGIITAQQKEIAEMEQWRADWGYQKMDAAEEGM